MTYQKGSANGRSALRRVTQLVAVSLLAFTGLAQTATAAVDDANAVFTGVITDTCSVNVLNPGVLGVNQGQTRLASDEIGGAPANALIITNSPRSSVQVLPPVAFETAPVGSDVNTSFETAYTLVGTTNASVDDGNTLTDLQVGASDMVITAGAEKSEGSFEGGSYTFVTTVRCVTP